MLYGGIDVGSLTAEAVVVRQGGKLVASAQLLARSSPEESAQAVVDRVCRDNGLNWQETAATIATGYGRERVVEAGLAQNQVSEISCHGFGAFCAVPAVRTIIDIGGQDAKVIKIDGRGELVNFVMNDKCAAGTGQFLELMARTLGVGLEELGRLSLTARGRAEVSARCSIFAETEVVHYLEREVPREDIAAGVNQAMAERVGALVRRVGAEPAVALTGGVAKNVAVQREVEKRLQMRLVRLGLDPQLVGAFGAAMLAEKGAAS